MPATLQRPMSSWQLLVQRQEGLSRQQMAADTSTKAANLALDRELNTELQCHAGCSNSPLNRSCAWEQSLLAAQRQVGGMQDEGAWDQL